MSQRERGDMRQRIVTLLRDYPEGLSPMQTQQLLGVDKALRSTMKAMVRDGLLTRVALGGVPAVLEQKTRDYSIFAGFWYGPHGACVV
jgi:hypothetical protein